MQLLFKSLTGKDHKIDVDSATTIMDLKMMLAEQERISREQLRLVSNGKVLGIDSETLASYRITSGNVVHIVLALRGG